MALTVREIRAWLDTLNDNDLVGIHEDEGTLTLADENYGLAYLEIGMALSADFLNRQAAAAGRPLPYPDNVPNEEDPL